MSKKKRINTASPGSLKANPFGALANLSGSASSSSDAAQSPTPAQTSPEQTAQGPARAVVRYQRKGRGGKEVTLVEKLGLDDDKCKTWLKDLKKTLGCGGFLEDGDLVFAGDQRKRLPELLTKRGVGSVKVS